jgi:hypothetical protein
MKLASRPKNRPIGAAADTASPTGRIGRPFRPQKPTMPATTPRRPPWNDMPPCQTARISPGFAAKYAGW